MRDDELILALSSDLPPVRLVSSPAVSTALWVAGASLVLAAGVGVSRIRPDLWTWLARPDAALEVGIAALTALLAAFAAFQLAIPGRSRLWAVPPLLGGLTWLALLGVGCVRDWAMLAAAGGSPGVETESSPTCLIFIAGFGTPVLLLTLALARHALPLRPLPIALLAGLAASAWADAGLVLVDHPHAAATTLIWHGGAALFLAGMAALLGPWWMRRAARWFGLADRR